MLNDPDSEATSGYDLFWLSEKQPGAGGVGAAVIRGHDTGRRLPDPLLQPACRRRRQKAPGRNCFSGISIHRAGRYVLPSPAGRGACTCLPSPAGRGAGGEGNSLGPAHALVKVTASRPPLTVPPAPELGAAAALSSSGGNTVGQANRGTLQVRSAGTLARLVEEADRMAAEGGGRTPKYLAVVPPDLRGRRQYSFSRLSGGLHARHTCNRERHGRRYRSRRSIPGGWARWSTRSWPIWT